VYACLSASVSLVCLSVRQTSCVSVSALLEPAIAPPLHPRHTFATLALQGQGCKAIGGEFARLNGEVGGGRAPPPRRQPQGRVQHPMAAAGGAALPEISKRNVLSHCSNELLEELRAALPIGLRGRGSGMNKARER